MSMNEMEAKIAEMQELDKLAQEAKEAADAIRDEIKAIMQGSPFPPLYHQRLKESPLPERRPKQQARDFTTAKGDGIQPIITHPVPFCKPEIKL